MNFLGILCSGANNPFNEQQSFSAWLFLALKGKIAYKILDVEGSVMHWICGSDSFTEWLTKVRRREGQLI